MEKTSSEIKKALEKLACLDLKNNPISNVSDEQLLKALQIVENHVEKNNF